MTTTDYHSRDDSRDIPRDDLDDNRSQLAPVEEPSAQEHEAKGELVQGTLAGQTIYVPPVKQWRSSALHQLREGDFDEWAKATLADDDWEIWEDVDPTMQEIEDFFSSVNTGLGADRGNSRASRRSRKNTRTR